MKKIYLNHDGGVDDLISLFLLLQMKDVEVIGVGVIPADCYLEPAVSASKKIINRFSDNETLQVAASDSRGVNPFPKEWRMHAFYLDALPILNEFTPKNDHHTNQPAHIDLVHKVKSSDTPVTLIFIGPLTDLARALDEDPSIEDNIEKLVWMGGTFLDKGNVEEPEHDGTAEWNAFWDPVSAKRVWESSIKIDLVALESTRKVPLTKETRDKWAVNRSKIGIDFVGQSYAAVPPLEHFVTNSTYFLWDVLTTLSVGKESLVSKKEVKSTVISHGPSQGKTTLDEDGRVVNLVHNVSNKDFFDYLEELAENVK